MLLASPRGGNFGASSLDKLVESSTNKVYYLDPSTNLTVWALPEDGYVNSNEEEASPGPG